MPIQQPNPADKLRQAAERAQEMAQHSKDVAAKIQAEREQARETETGGDKP